MLRVSLKYTRCRPTHPISLQWWARVAAHCWFNAGQFCTTLAQHHSTSVCSNHRTANQCCVNVDPTCLTMVQQQPAFCIHRLLCGNCYRGNKFISRGQKGHYPYPLAQLWNNVGLGHRLRRWANIILTKTLQALIIDLTTNIIVNKDLTRDPSSRLLDGLF